MAYSSPVLPALSPSGPAAEDLSPKSTNSQLAEPELASALTRIGESIADREVNLDVIFGQVAEAAHGLTGATAAAVAVRTAGVVTCRGRSGELAPELGAHLSVDSGISGECLRTGKTLRCDDTLKDFRADPEVCGRLGLRSIAAVPLRGPKATTGVLEAFSTRPYAFADEHMTALRQLAELAEQARFRGDAPPATVVPAVQTPSPRRLAVVSAAFTEARTVAAARSQDVVAFVRERMRDSRIRYVTAVSALALLLIAGVLAWKPWRKPAGKAQAPAAAPAQPAGSQAEVSALSAASQVGAAGAKAELVWTPPAGKRDRSSKDNKGEKTTSEPEVVTKFSEQPPASASTAGGPDSAPAAPVAEAKLLPASGTKSLGGVLAGTAAMPQLARPVSSGVTEGVLIHRVAPVYPQIALPLRIQGEVVLKATVTESGRVSEVSAVRGDNMLTRAAIDAVKQWRYRPYMLNGKPVSMDTEITVNFKLPR